MTSSTSLLTFSLGPVHTFIAQARRVADLWAGSDLLSHLSHQAIEALRAQADCEMVYPFIAAGAATPPGLPNRFVCRIPSAKREAVARTLEQAVRTEWQRLVDEVSTKLEPLGLAPSQELRGAGLPADAAGQAESAIEIAWSWAEENGQGYAGAAGAGARAFTESRDFRPFLPIHELGEKCTLCGERAALPNGKRRDVHQEWQRVADEKEDAGTDDRGFFRFDQTRLCLVCATKRLYPTVRQRGARFLSFQEFEPRPSRRRGQPRAQRDRGDAPPYFALVALDGDLMSTKLSWSADHVPGGDVQRFHRTVSALISEFAQSLRSTRPDYPQLLNWEPLLGANIEEPWPRLIYAGGEDVLLISTARDALRIAHAIRKLYRKLFADLENSLPASVPESERRFTLSAGVLFAHSKYPAGLLYREVDGLLNEVAKAREGRDAVAIRLLKRSGPTTEVAFHWDEVPATGSGRTWVDLFDALLGRVAGGELASRQTYQLREEEETLSAVFGQDFSLWRTWLTDRLSRGEASREAAAEMAELIAPFFAQRKSAALRIARFLGREMAARSSATRKEPS